MGKLSVRELANKFESINREVHTIQTGKPTSNPERIDNCVDALVWLEDKKCENEFECDESTSREPNCPELKDFDERIAELSEDNGRRLETSIKRLSQSDPSLRTRNCSVFNQFQETNILQSIESTLARIQNTSTKCASLQPTRRQLSQSVKNVCPGPPLSPCYVFNRFKDSNCVKSFEAVLSRKQNSVPKLPSNEVLAIIQESQEVEQNYIETLRNGIANYVHQFDLPQSQQVPPIPAKLKGQKYHIFRNIERMLAFHEIIFFPAIRKCENDVFRIAHTVRNFFTVKLSTLKIIAV